jgi:hypothetical protein
MGAISSSSSVKAKSRFVFEGKKAVKDPELFKKGCYFEPTDTIAWLIGNTDYNQLRMAGK